MIRLQEISKKFNKNTVLVGLNAEIDAGEVVAILGPNGSGKTTLIKSILGMVIPDGGEILMNERDIRVSSDYRHEIDYLPQIANFPANLKVKELLRMIKDIRGGQKREEELIKLFGIESFLDKRLSKLSGGTKQKVNIVITFMFDSPILILDEPTTGLDPLALIKLKSLIESEKSKGKTILITSHIMSFVEEVANRIIFLLEGKTYFNGSLTELITQTNQNNLEHAIAALLEEKDV